MSNVTPETLTRAEAHRKLLALGMPANVAADYLGDDPPFVARSMVSLTYPGAWPILEAYRRHCKSKAATDSLDTVPAEERERVWQGGWTSAMRDSVLTPVEEAEIIASAPAHIGPWTPESWNKANVVAQDEHSEVCRRMQAALFHIRTAQQMALELVPGGEVRLAIVAKDATGAGSLAGDFDANPFLADVTTLFRVFRTAGPTVDSGQGIEARAEGACRAFEDAIEPEDMPAHLMVRAAWREVVRYCDSSARAGVDPSALSSDDASLVARAGALADIFVDAAIPANAPDADYRRQTAKAHARTLALPSWLAVVRAVGASRPVPVAAAADRLASGHVQRLRDGTWGWCHDGGFDNGVVTFSPATNAWLSEVVKDAGRSGLTEEQLDVLARAMPDVVDYERATPEQRRSTVLDVLAAHGPRPLAPGHVAVPRAALESLVKATQYEDDVRDAREMAKRVLHQDFLRHEPARTDPEAARALAEARAERDSGDASLEADDPSPIERLAREFDRAAFKQGCGAINHDRGDCYRDAAKRVRAVAAEYLGLTEEQAGNVQSVRRRLGLTQERLGVEIGYRGETISRWENGHEAVPRVVRLALIGLIASHGEPDAKRGAK